jgi:hypothetical protein
MAKKVTRIHNSSGVNMITLWGRNNSTNVKKVLWTLEELDLPFNQIMAGMAFGVNRGRLSGDEPERPGAAAAR